MRTENHVCRHIKCQLHLSDFNQHCNGLSVSRDISSTKFQEVLFSGFCRSVDEIFDLLWYHAALSGSSIPTLRDKLSVPSEKVKKPKKKVGRFGTNYWSHLQRPRSLRRNYLSSWTSRPMKMRQVGCPETSVRNYHSPLRNIPEERRFHEDLFSGLRVTCVKTDGAILVGLIRDNCVRKK
jgi:hypothetical protein